MNAATPAAQAIFSYDYRTFDASVAKARTFITGGFVGEYAKTTAALKPTAVKVQAIVQAQVSAVGSSRSPTATLRSWFTSINTGATRTSPERRSTRTGWC